ncbi:MAG: 23S rRNA (adenine(2503)-C(2))-methyltransferase RlmN, partial [Candidatus Cloacimonetes bacterium]|nr:23S rRNA (adenine(2503)-C(2))-methyltransferase RlmN [Candidatus Cloacimonadota bacterium]
MLEKKTNIYSLSSEELFASLIKGDTKSYRVQQLLNWLYQKFVNDTNGMTNLPLSFRKELNDKFSFSLPEIIKKVDSKDGSTKYLLKLEDDEKIEMVLMPSEEKTTLCLSSQVGCSRDCKFCATGKLGLTRNLQTHEIIGQIVLAMKLLSPNILTNIVFMGMGEPMDNFENLIKSLKILADTEALCFSARRTTVSTCGVVPQIRRFADSGVKAKLAVSLNSAIDSKRDELMPVNRLYPLAELKDSLRHYLSKNTFRITFEYVLIKDFNMGREDLKALIKFTGDLSCKINLISWNQVVGLAYKSPDVSETNNFRASLLKVNKAVMFRDSRGNDIAAACGQLAYNYNMNEG